MLTLVYLLAVSRLATSSLLPYHGVTVGIQSYSAPVHSSYYHNQDDFGQYVYGYASKYHAKDEIKTADGVTRGGYSYIDANGILQTVQYISDPINGFRVSASNIPRDLPEVTLAKLQHHQAYENIRREHAAIAAQLSSPIPLSPLPLGNSYVAPISAAKVFPVVDTKIEAIPYVPKEINYIPVPVSTYHSQGHEEYSYGYTSPLSSKSETKSNGVTRGGYSYIDANGVLQSVQYISDPVNGFRVDATNLPEAPQVILVGPKVTTSITNPKKLDIPDSQLLPSESFVNPVILSKSPDGQNYPEKSEIHSIPFRGNGRILTQESPEFVLNIPGKTVRNTHSQLEGSPQTVIPLQDQNVAAQTQNVPIYQRPENLFRPNLQNGPPQIQENSQTPQYTAQIPHVSSATAQYNTGTPQYTAVHQNIPGAPHYSPETPQYSTVAPAYSAGALQVSRSGSLAAAHGVTQGTHQVIPGSPQLIPGVSPYSDRALQYSAGTVQNSAGTPQFNSRAPELNSAALQLGPGTPQLNAVSQNSAGASQYSAAPPQLNSGSPQLNPGVIQYTSGAPQNNQGVLGAQGPQYSTPSPQYTPEFPQYSQLPPQRHVTIAPNLPREQTISVQKENLAPVLVQVRGDTFNPQVSHNGAPLAIPDGLRRIPLGAQDKAFLQQEGYDVNRPPQINPNENLPTSPPQHQIPLEVQGLHPGVKNIQAYGVSPGINEAPGNSGLYRPQGQMAVNPEQRVIPQGAVIPNQQSVHLQAQALGELNLQGRNPQNYAPNTPVSVQGYSQSPNGSPVVPDRSSFTQTAPENEQRTGLVNSIEIGQEDVFEEASPEDLNDPNVSIGNGYIIRGPTHNPNKQVSGFFNQTLYF